MGLIEKQSLVAALSPPLDRFLAAQLIDEFVSLEKRFIQRDWEPAELDGGQFCEVLARILYHQDSGTLSLGKDFKDCCSYVEEEGNRHAVQPRRDALHLVTVMRATYKFRSQRGAVHVSPTYVANHMDAKFMMEAVRWALNETLRLFWSGDREAVAKAVREILRFDTPCVARFEDEVLVQRTDLSVDEEVLILLHFAGESGFTRRELGAWARFPPQRVSDALKRLTSPGVRQVILAKGTYRLTDLGARCIREDLAPKLLVQ